MRLPPHNIIVQHSKQKQMDYILTFLAFAAILHIYTNATYNPDFAEPFDKKCMPLSRYNIFFIYIYKQKKTKSNMRKCFFLRICCSTLKMIRKSS